MSDYKVDYAGIDAGTDTAKVMSNQTGNAKSSLSDAKTILDNEAVFMGPIKDNVIQEVSALESDPFNNKISVESPLGVAIKGHKIGDTVQVESPNGGYSVKILNVV